MLVIDMWDGVGTESLSDVEADVVLALEFVMPVSCFVEVLSDVVVKALAVGIATDVLPDMNLNVLAVIMTALEFSTPILE